MAILKCKICGGDLTVDDSLSIGTCNYCGSKMTIPGKKEEALINLFNRANDLRRNSEFDRAATIYENILSQDSNEAEAYWGLVLCKYGVEYVDDPALQKSIPTCHRTLKSSIFADTDYKMAIDLADTESKQLYSDEAAAIDSIQKQILALSMKEEPFDVFISYKEKNEDGSRTKDSYRAQELYDSLTKDGFKVFFSRVSLEDKLGEAYEPTIYAALTTSKVMVVVGSKKEHFNSPWVKNEWGRYLKLINNGDHKTLIPAYLDMDPYDLPDEFSHLQAQDMTKLGFLQDLVRGIKKIIGAAQSNKVNDLSSHPTQVSATVDSLLERAFLCLELGDFDKADVLLEQVLNINPKSSKAYTGKLMIDLTVNQEDQLAESVTLLDQYDNYQMAIRFSDPQTRSRLEEFNKTIVNRLEEQRKDSIYQEAVEKIKYSHRPEDFSNAAIILNNVKGYKDADKLIEDCNLKAKELIYRSALNKKDASFDENGFLSAASIFKQIKGYKDAEKLSEECEILAKESIYAHGVQKKSVAYNAYTLVKAADIFKNVSGYKDADKLRDQCLDLAKKYEQKENRRPFVISGFIVLISIIVFLYIKNQPKAFYNKGASLLQSKDYIGAIEYLNKSNNFADSVSLLKIAYYQHGFELLEEGENLKAAYAFTLANDYQDSKELASTYLQKYQGKIACGAHHTIGVTNYGTVVAVGNNDFNQLNIGNWRDIIAVTASPSGNFTVGLKNDGTVVAVGDNKYGQTNVNSWDGVVSIAASSRQTVGLRFDGKVLVSSLDEDYKVLTKLNSGDTLVAGGILWLTEDGSAMAFNPDIQSAFGDWVGLISVASGMNQSIGLKSDGSVIAAGSISNSDLKYWKEIVFIASGADHVIGIKSDGSVVAAGKNYYGQANVSSWRNVVLTCGGVSHTVALKESGELLAVGENKYRELEVLNWDLIKDTNK